MGEEITDGLALLGYSLILIVFAGVIYVAINIIKWLLIFGCILFSVLLLIFAIENICDGIQNKIRGRGRN